MAGRLAGRLLERLIDSRADGLELLAAIHADLAKVAPKNRKAGRAAAYLRGWVRGHFLPLELPDVSGAYP
jgi:hypothetical protein